MKCNICDRTMVDEEISFNPGLDTFDPCSTCMTIILEAAYGSNPQKDELEDVFLIDTEFDDDSYERTSPEEASGCYHRTPIRYDDSDDSERI